MCTSKLLTLALSLGMISPAVAVEHRKHVLKGPIPVAVVRVVDGDTFLARAEVWLGQEITVLVRIRGIDAPEMKARCESERIAANLALDQLTAILASHQIELRNISGEKYFGRVLADVVVEESQDPAALLLSRAMVRTYAGKKRQSWC